VAGASKNKIGPGDAVLIRVNNALADQPIGDVFYVEPMGTIALGPSYGRVDVSGLSILEAEEAVKKHLMTVVENPQVQLTLAGRAAPSATFAGASTYPIATTTAAPSYRTVFDKQDRYAPQDATTIPDQPLLERIDAMKANIQALQDELAKLKMQSEKAANAHALDRQ